MLSPPSSVPPFFGRLPLASMALPPPLPLPRGWPRRVSSAVAEPPWGADPGMAAPLSYPFQPSISERRDRPNCHTQFRWTTTPLPGSVDLSRLVLVSRVRHDPVQCPAVASVPDRQVPRAPLPGVIVTHTRVASRTTSMGVTPSSSLLWAHAPDQHPPAAFRP